MEEEEEEEEEEELNFKNFHKKIIHKKKFENFSKTPPPPPRFLIDRSMPDKKDVIADLLHVVEHSKNSTVRQVVADALAHHEISEIKKAILCSIRNEKSITATWLRVLVIHIFDA